MSSSPIFHGCVNERLADRTPSPTFSTADSDITELADEQQDAMEDFDDEAFVDDTGSDAGTEEGSELFSDGHDPFYDRSPWFILVGRLVRSFRERPKGTSSCSKCLCAVLARTPRPYPHGKVYLVLHTAAYEDHLEDSLTQIAQ